MVAVGVRIAGGGEKEAYGRALSRRSRASGLSGMMQSQSCFWGAVVVIVDLMAGMRRMRGRRRWWGFISILRGWDKGCSEVNGVGIGGY